MIVLEILFICLLCMILVWVVLQCWFFVEVEEVCCFFGDWYMLLDGCFCGVVEFIDCDGVDDLYEFFFNWFVFYLFGGFDEVFVDVKWYWEGVIVQFEEVGMFVDEYDNGYDWFYQGELLLFFVGICVVDLVDIVFVVCVVWFVVFFIDFVKGNYDVECNMICLLYNGVLGVCEGFDEKIVLYIVDWDEMCFYGLLLYGLDGIVLWDDFVDFVYVQWMVEEMQCWVVGDIVVNFVVIFFVVNCWFYDGDEEVVVWICWYVDGWCVWVDGGLFFDNVGFDGMVGFFYDGCWWGGYYGWVWLYGLYLVGMSVLIGVFNYVFVMGDDVVFDFVCMMFDIVFVEVCIGSVVELIYSLCGGWMVWFGVVVIEFGLFVLYCYGVDGWFDYGLL